MSIVIKYAETWRNGKPVPPRTIEFDGRPLVVIDPESREHVERLAEELYVWGLSIAGAREKSATVVGAEYRAGMADRVQGALRDIINPPPPKPDEPTGLGAVVEDDRGRVWVRVAGPDLTFAWRIQGIGSRYSDNRHWIKVPAVKVLSEGVTP